MNKNELKKQLIEILTQDLETLISAATEAKIAATHEEAKAENKYDTRGLEASYLAGAQAKRADELATTIDKLNKLNLKEFDEDSAIGLTALVTTQDQDGVKKTFFILPYGGGTKLQVDNQEVFVITTQAPMGKSILGLFIGDELKVQINQKNTMYEILKIS